MAPGRRTPRPGQGPLSRTRPFYGIDTVPRVDSVNPNTGRASGGLAVTITGRNFRVTGNGVQPTVTFNGLPATSVVVVDRQTITCVTPAQTESLSADVVVAVGSQTGTLFGGFTYVQAVITSIVPAFGPISGGTVVSIVGYNFQLGSTIYFDGTLATNVIFIDSQHMRATTPNHSNGFVDVIIVGP